MFPGNSYKTNTDINLRAVVIYVYRTIVVRSQIPVTIRPRQLNAGVDSRNNSQWHVRGIARDFFSPFILYRSSHFVLHRHGLDVERSLNEMDTELLSKYEFSFEL